VPKVGFILKSKNSKGFEALLSIESGLVASFRFACCQLIRGLI
jgi:hypothetical protein